MVERPLQNGQKDRAHRGEPKKATASPTCSFAGVFARKSINVIFSPSFRHSVRPAAVDRPSAASQPPVFITLVVLFPAAVHAVARLHGTGFVPRGLARSFPLSLPLFRNCTCNFTCRTGLRLEKFRRVSLRLANRRSRLTIRRRGRESVGRGRTRTAGRFLQSLSAPFDPNYEQGFNSLFDVVARYFLTSMTNSTHFKHLHR